MQIEFTNLQQLLKKGASELIKEQYPVTRLSVRRPSASDGVRSEYLVIYFGSQISHDHIQMIIFFSYPMTVMFLDSGFISYLAAHTSVKLIHLYFFNMRHRNY